MNKRQHRLDNYIDELNIFFNNSVKFYMAGSSIFYLKNSDDDDPENRFNDIDVWFNNEQDLNIALKFVSNIKNKKIKILNSTIFAVTFKLDTVDKPIQLIKKYTGTPEEMFHNFDLSCSMCAYTSDKKYITGFLFNGPKLDVNLEKLSILVIERYFKYLKKSLAVDENYKTLYKIIDYLIINRDKVFDDYYFEPNVVQTGENILGNIDKHAFYFIRQYNKESDFNLLIIIVQYIHDKILKLYDEDFTINFFVKHYNLTEVEINNPSIEFISGYLINHQNIELFSTGVKEKINRYKDCVEECYNKYPQYFI